MLYCKWIGACLMLSTGTLLSILLIAYERWRARQAEGFLTLLRAIRMQIDCFSAPIPAIFDGVSADLLIDCGVTERVRDLPALLAGTRLYQTPEICRLLAELAAQLGGGTREEQLRCCDYYLTRLAPYCENLRGMLPQREKTAVLLGVAAAILPLLLLL